MKFLKSDQTSSQDLSSAALDFTTTHSKTFKLDSVSVQASVNITETITITLDSVNGASYDVVLRKQSIVASQSFVYRPEGHSDYQAGDKIRVQCTKANATGTVYVTVKTSEVSPS